jgi:hypothetical protein
MGCGASVAPNGELSVDRRSAVAMDDDMSKTLIASQHATSNANVAAAQLLPDLRARSASSTRSATSTLAEESSAGSDCYTPKSEVSTTASDRDLRASSRLLSKGSIAAKKPVVAISEIEDLEDEPCSPGLLSQASNSHLDFWTEPGETLLIIDWDDTLFSRTSFDEAKLRRFREDPEQLQEHYEVVIALLRNAAVLSRVIIVTMATPQWIDDCIQYSMPGFKDVAAELGINFVYARDGPMREAKRQCRDPAQFLKTAAMTRIIKEFYRGRSWKNIMSIGDSHAERLALQDVALRHSQRDRNGAWKEFRYKTVRLLSDPTLEELTKQLRIVTNWLPTLLHHDDDLDLEFDPVEMTLTGEGFPDAGGICQKPPF